MNSNWKKKTIGELCLAGNGKVQTGPFGSQLHQSDYSDEGTPVVMPADIPTGKIDVRRIARVSESHVQRLSRHHLERGDIVYGRRGDIGRQAIVRDKNVGWLCGTGCLRIRLGHSEVDPEFLHRYLTMPEIIGWIKGQAIGATMPNLNTNILNRVPIYFPDLPTQRKIAAILTAYDDLIETNQRRIALLEQMAEELYREWFVRMRFPGHEKTKFVKGVPEGWVVTTIGELVDQDQASLQTGPFGTYLKASDYVDEGTPVINVRNIGNGRLRPDKLEFLSGAKVAQLHQHVLKENDIVFGRKGAVERHLLVSENENGWVQGSDCIRLRLNSAPISCRYLSQLFSQKGHQEWMMNQCSGGATMASLNEPVLRRISFYNAGNKISAEFDHLVKPIFATIDQLISQNQTLTQTRDLLLPRLISGKLSVEDLDIQFPPGMTNSSDAKSDSIE